MAISKIITSSLTDDAVTSAKIGTDQVGADALSSSAISGAVDIPANSVGQSELVEDYTAQSVPHIIPGVLYPAVAGKLLDGTTSHSGNYGTPQTQTGGDGRSYYYTDIKGSKPIKDPRIGAHFGSQRHKLKSLQLLEQETANHGSNVYSIDGREWVRAVDVTDGALGTTNDSVGQKVTVATDKEGWIEVVGYFNAVNLIMRVMANRKSLTPYINGVEGSTQTPQEAINTPLDGRFVESGSVISLTLPSTSLGINTLRIKDNIEGSHYTNYYYGIELIAQDTASTARRSEIKIPKQNVVSFGKKFEVGSDDLDNAVHPHYDPFNGFTSGSSVSSYVDTATSLGLDKWLHSSTYYRPYNGGRVVKWVDSSGVIKTSVTMMPPNAQTTFGVAKDEKGDDSAGNTSASVANDNFKPTISDQSVDFSLLETATSLHYREFGNGSANRNTTYADVSTLDSSADDIAYVMDDGLTSLSGDDSVISGEYLEPSAADDVFYLTFIGTGCSWNSNATKSQITNLPYGTHILKGKRTGNSPNYGDWTIDGQEFTNATNGYYGVIRDYFDIHQPKRPPIPEDACVLADYMLMADHVVASTANPTTISKGVRRLSPTRDVYYKDGSWNFYTASSGGIYFTYGMGYYATGDSDHSITSFATNAILGGYDFPTRYRSYEVDGSVVTTTKTGTSYSSIMYPTSSSTLGVHTFGADGTGTSSYDIMSYDLVTPIHTSFHYQSFETPFLHELVGGDRNMEQTNLVVSPDGKTWDEVTRDTSYIGGNVLNLNLADGSGSLASGVTIVWNKFRGSAFAGSGQGYTTSPISFYNKNFAIANDQIICLVGGQYELCVWGIGESGTGGGPGIKVNSSTVCEGHYISGSHSFSGPQVSMQLNRGDRILYYGALHNNDSYSGCFIRKL